MFDSKLQSQFQAIELRTNNFSAYLDALTPNTYIMVVTADPRIGKSFRAMCAPRFVLISIHAELSAIKLNVQLARDHFERMPALNISSR
jgi:Ras-related GTP-binding protein A/B